MYIVVYLACVFSNWQSQGVASKRPTIVTQSEEVLSSNPDLQSDAEDIETDSALICDTETVMSDSGASIDSETIPEDFEAASVHSWAAMCSVFFYN